MTLKVIRLLPTFPNATFRTVLQQLTRFHLTCRVAQSLEITELLVVRNADVMLFEGRDELS